MLLATIVKLFIPGLLLMAFTLSKAQEESGGDASVTDVGPDTCGQERAVLANWFWSHGAPMLIAEPVPPLTTNVTSDPYSDPSNPPVDPLAATDVCGVRWVRQSGPEGVDERTGLRRYHLRNFTSAGEALEMGFSVTHTGHCGACSSLQDLGTYMKRNLTSPTRMCGALGWLSESAQMTCLRMLGFTHECATIWAWNIRNTRSKCLQKCLWSWWTGEPNNRPDGSLNDCLQCDEDQSGPNFKYFSGRTRRNSGIPSAIHRPPWQISNITHCYWYGNIEEEGQSICGWFQNSDGGD